MDERQRQRDAPHRRAIAIGVFDGLHRGHAEVIRRLTAHARAHNLVSCVVTFDPHPALVLAPERAPRLLATLDQRVAGLRAWGVDEVRVVHFDASRSRQSASDFVREILVEELAAQVVVVGANFRFGHDREGSPVLLATLGERYDFTVDEVTIRGGQVQWSSTAVREALERGDLDAASEILGRSFTLRGPVVHGDARGREIGFPTANVAASPRQQLPRVGIYAGATVVQGVWWPAAISVGRRPHFYEQGAVLVEVHLPGFSGDLYDSTLDVLFWRYLRDEARYDTLEALIHQIGLDVAETQEIFRVATAQQRLLLG
ncbi:MAG: bifunctional riboflavin kinase/FAD synthetase [Acidobacteriota bacterium]|nr:bifunctional riboflavin kinase/FAD synthetase [Acidobacteriota bacterium]